MAFTMVKGAEVLLVVRRARAERTPEGPGVDEMAGRTMFGGAGTAIPSGDDESAEPMNDFDRVLEMPAELGAFDMLLHRGEAHPRTRSGLMSVEVLQSTPDWGRFRAAFDNASRQVPRMRQKVVVPTLPTTAPRWVCDADFSLAYHVRRRRVPAPGSLREVLDAAELLVQSPMDTSRPLWSVTLVEGLAGGQAAVLFHMSHAVTDGLGLGEL